MAHPNKDSHRIARLSLKLCTTHQAQALEWRLRLKQQWRDIEPALDAGLSAIVKNGEWLHIPRLEVRLAIQPGENPFKGLETDIANAIEERVRYLLRENPAGVTSFMSDTYPETSDGARITPSDVSTLLPPASSQDARSSPTTTRLVDTLFFYLNTGNLPWHSARDPDMSIQWRLYLSQDFAGFLNNISWPVSYAFAHRLLSLLDTTHIHALIEYHHQNRHPQQDFHLPIDIVLKLVLPIAQASSPSISQLWAKHLFGYWLTEQTGDSLYQRHQSIFRSATFAVLSQPISLGSEEEKQLQKYWQHLQANVFDSPKPESRPPDHTARVIPLLPRTEHRNKIPALTNPGDNIHVRNPAVPMAAAGLVLLHPYLPRFFASRGIRQNATAIEEHQIDRAASLLAYIATGNDSPPEYQLGFIKILLGLTPETPLPLAPGLIDENDRAEATNLLLSLIAHWPALGKISPDGLRQSFLIREGLVKKIDNGWSVTLEPTGYDILLDRLPFAFSLVKFPWIPQPIYVQW